MNQQTWVAELNFWDLWDLAMKKKFIRTFISRIRKLGPLAHTQKGSDPSLRVKRRTTYAELTADPQRHAELAYLAAIFKPQHQTNQSLALFRQPRKSWDVSCVQWTFKLQKTCILMINYIIYKFGVPWDFSLMQRVSQIKKRFLKRCIFCIFTQLCKQPMPKMQSRV